MLSNEKIYSSNIFKKKVENIEATIFFYYRPPCLMFFKAV